MPEYVLAWLCVQLNDATFILRSGLWSGGVGGGGQSLTDFSRSVASIDGVSMGNTPTHRQSALHAGSCDRCKLGGEMS